MFRLYKLTRTSTVKMINAKTRQKQKGKKYSFLGLARFTNKLTCFHGNVDCVSIVRVVKCCYFSNHSNSEEYHKRRKLSSLGEITN